MLKEAIGRPLERPQEGEASCWRGHELRSHERPHETTSSERPRAEIGHERGSEAY
jgi:hypothetical protein